MYQKYIKRLLAILMSVAGLFCLSWLFLIIIIAIKLDSPGPVFFNQRRVGIHKTHFNILKFRTMRIDTPKDMPTHLLADPDQFITKVGRFLRKTSLDELPQLINILTGDMAICGPRPALWNQFDLIAERDKYGANDVRPGLTGWAQINGRDELEIADKARLDGYYVEHLNFLMDVKCFFGTITSVLKSDGVVEGGTGSLGGTKDKMELKAFEKKLWLASPTMHGEEQKYVQEAFDKNWVSTIGENLDELSKGICQYIGCGYAVPLGSGTSALHLAMKLAGVKSGDKVFCSDMTFAATVNPVLYEKAEPVFIDCEYETWNMDPIALEKAFTLYQEIKVVVVVNLYGTPAKLDEIRAICDKHGAILIEDAAESLGATFKGVQTGTFGTYNAISFNGNKIITTSGGGMLLTEDKEAADKVRKWSTQARESAPWYQHEEIGYNYRMSNIVAGIGRGQLLHLDEHIAAKKVIYERYKEGFKDLPIIMNPYDKDTMKPNFWLSCMLINEEAMCKQIRGELDASYESEAGKSCPTEILEKLEKFNAEGRPIWKPMHMQPIYKNNIFVSAKDGQDVGADVFERGLCLPSDIKMTKEEQDMVIAIVKSCFE